MNDLLPLLPTPKLAQLCQNQISRYKAGEPNNGAFCYELFRRAAYDLPLAWDYIFQLYKSHICKRISKQSPGAIEASDDILQNVLVKFQRNVLTPERFKRFPNVGAIVAYLNGCVNTAVIDVLRKQEREKRADLFSLDKEESAEKLPSTSNTEDILMDKEWRNNVRDCIFSHCKHRYDELLVEQLWVNDLKPKEVYKLFPGIFSSVQQIHTQKRNLVNRIRRDPACRELIEHVLN